MISDAILLMPIQGGLESLIYSNNVEGCLVLSLALQNFDAYITSPDGQRTETCFHTRLPQILRVVLNILKSGMMSTKQDGTFPVNSFFRKHLIEVILSSFLFDNELALTVIEELQFTKDFFFLISPQTPLLVLRTYYERRLLISSLTTLMFQNTMLNQALVSQIQNYRSG